MNGYKLALFVQNGMTSLVRACDNGDLDVVKVLIDNDPITGSMIHHSYKVKGNNPLMSYDEPLTRTDNRINDPPFL